MRIIAGTWRGRKLEAPSGDGTRPTADRVRESLFSMLASRIGSFEDLRVADLFAGSGALGLEALSRGAAHCTFVETDRAALAALKANIATLNANADIRPQSALALPSARASYDLIFLDAPYDRGLSEKALEQLTAKNWVGPATWISAETARSEALDAPAYTIVTERPIAKARITLLRPTAS